MKNASEGEALWKYLEGKGDGEIRRGMDLSEVGEENPPKILKNHRREALVIRSHLLVARVELEEKKRRRGRRGAGGLFYRPGTRESDISDRSDMSGPDRIYLVNSDLAEIL
jgi:hypothetical protein